MPLNVGGGLCSTDNFQNLMDCSLYRPRNFQKISSKSIHYKQTLSKTVSPDRDNYAKLFKAHAIKCHYDDNIIYNFFYTVAVSRSLIIFLLMRGTKK